MISPRECVRGVIHNIRGLRRAILHLPVTTYFERMQAELASSNHDERQLPSLKLVLNHKGEPIVCHDCGYARARLVLKNGWEVESCTAEGFKDLINNKELDAWIAAMASGVIKVSGAGMVQNQLPEAVEPAKRPISGEVCQKPS